MSSQTTGVTNKDTGEPQKRYPLLINPIEVYAEIHRDVLFGMAQNYDEPPVRTVFRDGKSEGFAAQINPCTTASCAIPTIDASGESRHSCHTT